MSYLIVLPGPPHADQKELQKIGHIGDTVRLTCPVSGFPQPMVEWSKDGEKIDHMWDRHKTGRKTLRIKNVNEDDTGVFTCKAINGFGSEEVRVELIIVGKKEQEIEWDVHHANHAKTLPDPRQLPNAARDGSLPNVAPPVFTYDTRTSRKRYLLPIGNTFKVSCEALGSPKPEVFWFKDGKHLTESVRYERGGGGRSAVELNVWNASDAGVYTCRARNLVGERSVNFTLAVEKPPPTQNHPPAATHAIVTESGPVSTTVAEGELATLRCRVKSLAPPHIKWLKRLEAGAGLDDDELPPNALKVEHERYLILNTNKEVLVGKDEYLSKLVIPAVSAEDAGMYICFVTNSGSGALTYNSMTLKVLESKYNSVLTSSYKALQHLLLAGSVVTQEPEYTPRNSEPVLIIVVVFSVIVFLLLLVITVFVCSRRRTSTTKGHQHPETPEVQRPFVVKANINNNDRVIHSAASSSLPHWGHSVYPTAAEFQKLKPETTDSGFGASTCNNKQLELESCSNQYEVPYSHLLSFPQLDSATNSSRTHYAFGSAQYKNRVVQQQNQQSAPGLSIGGADQAHLMYQFRNFRRQHPAAPHYFSDYDSQ